MNIGSPAFRRRVLELIPNKRIQRVRELVDIMDQTTRQIWENKKAAFAKGDEAVLQQVGEGKDIVSKLCESFHVVLITCFDRCALFSASK